MITTNYYKGSPPRRPPSSRARVFARPRTPRSPNARDPIPSPAKKNTARTQSMFAPVARAPSSNPLPRRVVARASPSRARARPPIALPHATPSPSPSPSPSRVALSRRPPHSSTLVDARARPSPSRAVARRHARRPPSRRAARARERARARAVDDRAPVVRERPERAAQGALPVARPHEPEQLEGGARASRDASRATATRDRSRDAATRARDRSIRDATRMPRLTLGATRATRRRWCSPCSVDGRW